GFNGEFGLRMLYMQPFRDRFEQAPKLVRRKVCRRAAADEEAFDRPRAAEYRQFGREGFEVEVDEVILPRGHGEVAGAAVVRAERDVNVRGPRSEPGGHGSSGFHVPSSKLAEEARPARCFTSRAGLQPGTWNFWNLELRTAVTGR